MSLEDKCTTTFYQMSKPKCDYEMPIAFSRGSTLADASSCGGTNYKQHCRPARALSSHEVYFIFIYI